MEKGLKKIGSKRLIVNADDFGLTEGINRGISDGFKTGVVTSTSLLATMPSFDHAVQLALENNLDIGIHASLTLGKPCSENKRLYPILENGEFIKSCKHLFWSIYTRQIDLNDLKGEIASQIIKIRKNGLEISHINGHQHVLMLPCLFRLTMELMKEYHIPFFRIPDETIALSRLGSAKGWGFLALGLLSRCLKLRLRQSEVSVRTVDYYRGLSFSERMSSKDLMRTLASLKPGVSELICHPGYDDRTFHMIYEDLFLRERELRALKCSQIINFIKMNDIELISYRDLFDNRSCIHCFR
jgi:predicted glycoside hydrolase/deacetylase ChbG (UPF0249 family)